MAKKAPETFFSFEEAEQLLRIGASGFVFRNALGTYHIAEDYRDSGNERCLRIVDWVAPETEEEGE